MYKYLSNSIGFFFNILEQKDKVKYIFFFFLVFLSLFIELIAVGVIFGTIVSFLAESVFEKLKNIPLVTVDGRKMISIITEDLIKLLSK